MSITTTIKTIQDIMRKDAGVDGDAQRVSQLGWMLFLKIFDDSEQEIELLNDRYRSPIPDNLRWRNWADSDDAEFTGENLLNFVNNELFPKLKDLAADAERNPRGVIAKRVFEDAYNYMKNGTLLRQVINKLREINFNSLKDRQHFGDIYEQILRDLQSAGNAGEYYTPRAVTQFIVDMVDPQLGEKILDPACGTGGFLTCAIENIRKSYVKTPKDEETLQRSIFGVEKKPLPHLLCVTNMLLHQIEVPLEVRHDNTLARPLRDYKPSDRVHVIITNPPFGGMEEDGIEKNFPYQTRETADLFLQMIVHLLRDGGRGALVLPDGTLFGEGVKSKIKEKLLTECNLHTVVRLPNGVFAPYTGIKTNLLFFTKGEPTREIWFYEHPYPPGYKSYSKTKPIRIEEFAPEKEWWHNRVENEFAWKVDFAAKQTTARAAATPRWQAAEEAEAKAGALSKQVKDLNDRIQALRKPEPPLFGGNKTRQAAELRKLEDKRNALQTQEAAARDLARQEKSAGDSIWYAIFNLDIKNPNAPDDEHGDPEELLAAYHKLLSELGKTLDAMKDELMASLEQIRRESGVRLETFFDHLGLLTAAPNGVAKLRELILQLAVQGKLAPQDANDEPASALLEKIRAEKERLVKEKKIKKSDPLSPIELDQASFELPQGWEWVRIGELAMLIEYGTSEKATPQNIGVPVLRMNNIESGKITFDSLKYLPANIEELPKLYLKNDDLLFNRTNSYELVGKTGIFKGQDDTFTFASYLIRMRLFPEWVNPDYINLAMNSGYFRRTQIEPEITQQCGQANFNGTKLANTIIPLPPLAKQRRIVVKVDQLMALCDELEAKLKDAQAASGKLLEATVKHLLTHSKAREAAA